MKRLACVAGILFLAGTPALACPSPLTGKDAAGTTQSFGVTLDASTFCYGNIAIVDGANAANKATVTAGNALKVDGSAVTQPVSGTVTANQGGAPWSVSQSGNWTARVVGNAGGIFDFAGQNAAQPANSILIGGEFNTTPTTLVSPAASPLQLDSAGNLLVNLKANSFGTLTVAGTVTANQGTSPWVENVSQFGGSAVVTGTGASGAGIPRVTVANDSNVLATQSGTWTVQQGGAPWSITCVSGCTGGGGGGATTITNSAGQLLGGNIAGQNNIPFVVTPGATLASPPLFAATGIWDGQHYLSLVAPNSLATQAQTAIVVRNPDAGNIADPTYGGSGSATENSVLKGLYQAVTSSIPAGANTIGAVTQASGPWTVNCVSGCTGGGNASTVQIINAGAQSLGGLLPGQNNIPLQTTQATVTLSLPPLLAASALWDGKNYASFTPPSASAIALQPALVTTLSPNTPLPAGTNTLGSVTQSGGPWSVSGTVTANQGGTWTVQPGNTANTTPWLVSINQGGNTAAVNASSQLSVNCANCSGSGVSQQDATGFTFGTTNMVPVGGVYSSAPTPLTSGQAGVAILTQGRILEDNPRNSAGQEIGTNLRGANSVPIVTSAAPATLAAVPLLPATGLWDGTNYAAFTPPRASAIASQPALVVAVSPNTPLPSGANTLGAVTQAGAAWIVSPRNSIGQEIGAQVQSTYSPPMQVNIASQVQNNTLIKSVDQYGQLRTSAWITDGNDHVAVTAAGKPPRVTDSALVVTPSPLPSIQCPFIAAVSQTASTTNVTGQAGKFLHVCSYKLISASAQNVGLIEGTGSTCATGTTNLDGQGSSGSIALAANGGFQTGSGAGQVTIPMQKGGDNLCVVQSAAGNVSGYINYGVFN